MDHERGAPLDDEADGLEEAPELLIDPQRRRVSAVRDLQPRAVTEPDRFTLLGEQLWVATSSRHPKLHARVRFDGGPIFKGKLQSLHFLFPAPRASDDGGCL